jgi:hypothetical protein
VIYFLTTLLRSGSPFVVFHCYPKVKKADSTSKCNLIYIFKVYFDFLKMEVCQNSISTRANSELFIEFQKKQRISYILIIKWVFWSYKNIH